MTRVASVYVVLREHTCNLLVCLGGCMHRMDFVLVAVILKEQREESARERNQKKRD